jgi:hypothetical protein
VPEYRINWWLVGPLAITVVSLALMIIGLSYSSTFWTAWGLRGAVVFWGIIWIVALKHYLVSRRTGYAIGAGLLAVLMITAAVNSFSMSNETLITNMQIKP